MGICVDINCDMGESFGAYRIGHDEDVIRHISSANIACGFHASDPTVMERTVRLCKDHQVMAGAHPGYPDLMGFGRRVMDVDQEELLHMVVYQVGALRGFLSLHQMPLQHVKLHGALYNRMVNEEILYVRMATAVNRAFGDTILLTLGTKRTAALKKACREQGIRLALEAFPDRQYSDEGELLSRKHKDAVLKDPELIARRAVMMVKDQGIKSINGVWIDMDVDTLCIHGDNAESIEAARKIQIYCREDGIQIKPLHTLI